ncbi:MAG: histidinol dehydrogenase [Proteobacteria bacterium]|nr:histidinol dehydrogenase [Pseudomonadota bacterium]
MRVLNWATLTRSERAAALSRPVLQSRTDTRDAVTGILQAVRNEGDRALLRLTEEFDHVSLKALVVTAEEYRLANNLLSASQTSALCRAIDNVRRFHQAQHTPTVQVETEPGIRCGQLYSSIARVGLYVPSGSAPLPSALIMTAVLAQIAGCSQRVLCTPPRPDGSVHPAILLVAQMCGIDTVFKVGGAQAIAALAYGTDSIPKVDKIFGPGNSYVTAAKQQVAQDLNGVSCDLPAGPSEVLVIADSSARPDFIAADLLAQLEHDALSQGILVTPSPQLARDVASELAMQAPPLSRRGILAQSLTHCRCILVPDLEDAFEVSNVYSPEHLILHVEEPRSWLTRVRSAGSVFLGPWTPEALGDYCSGTNHVLPTYGYARSVSGLTLRDFQRVISVQEATPEGLRALGPVAVTLAELETLDGHARSVQRRLAALPKCSEAAVPVGPEARVGT